MSGFLGGGIGPVALKRRRAGNGLLNNLIAYWPLSEAGGANNAIDLHTNALHLTQNASPGSAAGKVYAGARTFNGSTQYFSRASEALLQTGDVDFTIAAWVYLTSLPADAASIVAKDNTVNREYYLFVNSAGNAIFQVYRSGPTARSANAGAISLNTWTLLIGYHSAQNDIVAASLNNATPVETTTGGALQAATTMPFNVGFMTASFPRYWPGRIGPVAMWKSAAGGGGVLTAAQRTALHNGGAGLAYADFTP